MIDCEILEAVDDQFRTFTFDTALPFTHPSSETLKYHNDHAVDQRKASSQSYWKSAAKIQEERQRP